MDRTCELCGKYGKVVRVRKGAIYAEIRLAHAECAAEWIRRSREYECVRCGNASSVTACCSQCARYLRPYLGYGTGGVAA